jgi:thiol-disulfide isomerase/thioredoxin
MRENDSLDDIGISRGRRSPRARAARWLAAVVLALGVLIAIGLVVRSDEPAEESSAASQLPSFTATTYDGEKLTRLDIATPAVIHFHASWCPKCNDEAPSFVRMQKRADGVNWYYVAVQDEADAAAAFERRYGFAEGVTIDDPDRDVEDAFGLTGQPNTVFVDGDGKIVHTQRGPGSYEELTEAAKDVAV